MHPAVQSELRRQMLDLDNMQHSGINLDLLARLRR
jgi:hypothetical protein